MKVCFVLHTAGMGGAERSVIELILELKKRGVECFALLPADGPLVGELEKCGVSFKLFRYQWWMGVEGGLLWKQIARTVLNLIVTPLIAAQAKKWRADIIYTNSLTVCVGAFAAKILGRPHIWHIREFGYEDFRLRFDLGARVSLWLMKHLSSVCIANSHAVFEKYSKFIPKQKLKVVYNAVANPTNHSSPDRCMDFQIQTHGVTGLRCVIVGALHEGKRQADAISAMRELIHEGVVNAQLYIVGEGRQEYKEYLIGLIAQNNLENHVSFLGYLENPSLIVQQVDLVLVCSVCEAFGRVTVEAMQAGKPVIGARSGATTELIRDGYNGLLYTPNDYSDLAQKMMYLYKHPEIAKEMGENGKKWATERFSRERHGEEVLSILEQL